MRQIAILCAMLALHGCNTKSVSEMSYTEVRAYGASLHKKCIEQGVKDGAQMQQCINQEALRDESARQANQERRLALAAAMQSVSDGYNASAASYSQPSPVRCTYTGTSTWVGGPVRQINQTCF